MLDKEMLLQEGAKVSSWPALYQALLFLALSLLLTLLCAWVWVGLLGKELPKTTILRHRNMVWVSRMEQLSSQLDRDEAALEGLEMRDNEIYRTIFGMNQIPSSVRNSGYPGLSRQLEEISEGATVWGFGGAGISSSSPLSRMTARLDMLTKKAYVQSTSYDDVGAVSKRAGDMVSCIPAISPLRPDGAYRLTSPFGYRSDPINGNSKMHTGMDFACNPGNPIYAVGDGVVESVSFELYGYGNSVMIDHGFGYKTRYAHMRTIYVAEGMKVRRGQNIGETGRSGRVTGPHLHYEVIYRGSYVNPINYLDLGMPLGEYDAMTKAAVPEGGIIRPHTRVRR